MSEASTVAPLPGGTAPVPAVPTTAQQRKQSKISEAVIRIAGNSQDGIQAIGGGSARVPGPRRARDKHALDSASSAFRPSPIFHIWTPPPAGLIAASPAHPAVSCF